MNQIFLENFQVPSCAEPILSVLLSETEIQFLSVFSPAETITAQSVARLMHLSLSDASHLLKTAYQKNIINRLSDEEYQFASFYDRLGAFCQFEQEKWQTVPEKIRVSIGDWYLQAFIQKNKPLWEKGKRNDQVVPLADALLALQKQKEPVFLTYCDCRSVFGNCNHSLETCISFSDDYNTPFDRGQARKISVEEACSLVKQWDKEGLIHTLEGEYGMCNCCTDCCFEYRAAKSCDCIGDFPRSYKIADYNKTHCISCGLCVKRCPMHAFQKKEKEILFNSSVCVGCGICVNACPKQSIQLISRPKRSTL